MSVNAEPPAQSRTIRLVVPTGSPPLLTPAVASEAAPVLAAGIVYLDNTKPNARQILQLLATDVSRLVPEAPAHFVRKTINTAPADPVIFDEVPAKGRVFVTGIGD